MPVIVMRDYDSKLLVAHVVPGRGAEVEWVAQQLVRDLQRLGHHARLVMKSDQEPALVSLLQAVAKLRGEAPTILDNSSVGGLPR